MREMRNRYKILDGKPEGMRTIRIHKHRSEDKIKMENMVGGCGLDSSGSGQRQVASYL
jgi:hypothetical protein